jgi:predicted protein tyrosine phosphatase
MWSLNWGIVDPRLIVGTCPMAAADLDRIKQETGVTAVLSLQHDLCLARWKIDYAEMARAGEALGLVMARCPIRDFDPAHTRERLPEAIRALAGLQAEGHRTYVHCTAGISRAPLTVFGYLTLVAGIEEEAARNLIMRARPESIPYWEAYEGARADLKARHRETIEEMAAGLDRSGLCSDRYSALARAEIEVLRAALSDD